MGSGLAEAKRRVDQLIDGYRRRAGMRSQTMLSPGVEAGKVYEIWILCHLLEQLHEKEEYAIHLRGGSRVTLKSSPGPINPEFPHFELRGNGRPLRVWTDVEFLALSHNLRNSLVTTPGDFHELDIAVVESGVSGRPRHDQIILGVECKHMSYRKDLLRTILGVRRELSLLAPPNRTSFESWPRRMVPANPASCLLVYCSSQTVHRYASPGETFGIDFFFHPPP